MYWTYSNTNGCRVVLFGCLAMIGSQVQIVLTLLTLTAEFVMVPGFAKASNHNSNFDVWFRHFISDFSFRTEKKSSRQVFISQPLSPTECKVANIPWLNIFIRGEMTGDLVMVWTWCHSKCCKNIYGIYDIVTCPWLCNDEKGHDLSWSFMRCMMIQHLAMFFSSLKHLEVFFNYYIILYKSQERHLFNKARPVLGNACGSGVCSCDSVTRFGGPWLQW